ncbi:MAG: cytidylate kinase-like family protein [Bacteroidales bacterium]
MNNLIITIGREIGSGGLTLAELLSKKLNIPYYDKRILTESAKQAGLNPKFFEKVDETVNKGFFRSTGVLCNEELFNIQCETMRHIATKGSCIFVGRCADYILEKDYHLLRIFIKSSIEERAKTIISKTDLNEEEALNKIKEVDKKRSEFYKYYSFRGWKDLSHYDLSFDSSIFPIEKISDIICGIYKELLFSINEKYSTKLK